jgi:membrane-bound metal-dependent hydrolase YbcI (DUF457 family)
MAQAGIHSIVGLAVRKFSPTKKWLLLGIVLGNLFPDADNIAVAIATLMGKSTEGLHRTFTHSLFFVAIIVILFYVIAVATKSSKWGNLGLGLGIGILMHIILDLLIWFNGVEILWPIPFYLNLWTNFEMPVWWSKLMMPMENLFFLLFFLLLASTARKYSTNGNYLSKLRIWTWVQGILFLLFLFLVYSMDSGFMTIFGAIYLLSLGLAFGITIRMRDTIEAFA